MAETKFGISQSKEQTPQWMVTLTAVLSGISWLGPDLINSLPVTVPATIKDWLEWGMRCVAAAVAILAVFSGKATPPSYKFRK